MNKKIIGIVAAVTVVLVIIFVAMQDPRNRARRKAMREAAPVQVEIVVPDSLRAPVMPADSLPVDSLSAGQE